MALTKIDDRGLKTPIDLLDDEKIRLGTGNDLELFHQGGYSIIKDKNDNPINIQTDGEIKLAKDGNAETYARFIPDGAVELYHNDGKKFETTNLGATITRDLTLNHASGDTALRWAVGGTNKFSLYESSGTLRFYDNTNSSERIRIVSNGEVGINITNPEAYGANGHGYGGLTVEAPSGSYSGITIKSGYNGGGALFFADGSGSNAERKNLGFTSDHINKRLNWIVEGSTVARFTEHGFHPNPADSAAANALDDYEEGTFTPALTSTNGGFSCGYTLQLGKYVKVGRVVHVSFYIKLSSLSANGTGNFMVTGLPYTHDSTSNHYSTLALGYYAGYNNTIPQNGLVNTNDTTVHLYHGNPNTSSVNSTAAAVIGNSSTFQFIMSGTYMTT